MLETLKHEVLIFAGKILRTPGMRGRVTISEALFKALNPKRRIVEMGVGNHPVLLDLSEPEMRYIFFGAFEPAERKFVESFLKRGDVVIDIGANVGYLSAVILNEICPNGSLYSFEPNPAMFERLEQVQRTSNGAMKSYRLAVGPDTGTSGLSYISFYINPDHSMWSSTDPRFVGTADAVEIKVETVSMSHFLDQHAIDHVDFIKIDVEGAKIGVLEGLRPFLETRERPGILCEFVRTREDDKEELLAVLEDYFEMGYSLYRLCPDGGVAEIETAGFDGFERTENFVI